MIRIFCMFAILLLAAGYADVAPTYAGTQSETAGARIEYRVSIRDPITHIYDIEMNVTGIREESVDVSMPAWSPGIYFILDYARNVQQFAARTENGRPLNSEQIDKQTWRISKNAVDSVRIRYQLYSTDLIDSMADLSTPAGAFMYVAGYRRVPVTVEYDAPSGWDVHTGLERRGGRYHAATYDVLADAPALMGRFKVLEFETDDKIPHRIVISNPDIGMIDQQVIVDLQDLVHAATGTFGPLPYTNYTFFIKVRSAAGAVGVAHFNSTHITVGENDFVNQAGYQRFLDAAAQTLVQAWTGKRIRIAALSNAEGDYEYSKEAYTRLLWFTEGVSNYYRDLLQIRAGLLTPAEFISQTSVAIDALQHQQGRLAMSLEEASWNTWLRSDNSTENTVSYPVKGAIVAMLLDLEIRARTSNEKSLDDVIGYLMTRYAASGQALPENGVLDAIEAVAESDFREFYDTAIRGRSELQYDRYLRHAGMQMDVSRQPSTIYFGIETERAENNQARIRRVTPNSPAQRARLDAGDTLVAIDAERVTFDNLSSRVRSQRIGEAVPLTVLRGERLLTLELTPMAFQEERWSIVDILSAPASVLALREHWLRDTL